MTIDSDEMRRIVREYMLDKALLGEQVYINPKIRGNPAIMYYYRKTWITVYFPNHNLDGWTHPLLIIDLIDQGNAEFLQGKKE